jgi:5-methylcytosine-specific restriction endonuclease McrA
MKKPISYNNRKASVIDKPIKEPRKPRNDKGKQRKTYNIQSDAPDNYRKYIYRANAKGIVFNLTIEEFNNVINGECSYCGEEQAGTIDRINSSKGYTIDNITPCCSKCNIMKYTHSVKDFIKHVNKIYNHMNAINNI